jgi:hypothetical protein
MWRNPKYYPAAPATAEPAPPEPAGETLIEFERNRGAERLRVSLEEYQGHEYVRLQVWARGPSGDWWPVKGKCVTVKLREVDGLVAALRQVEGRADHQASGLQQGRARAVSGLGVGGPYQTRSGSRDGGGGDPRRPTLPLGNGGAFDEFGGGQS